MTASTLIFAISSTGHIREEGLEQILGTKHILTTLSHVQQGVVVVWESSGRFGVPVLAASHQLGQREVSLGQVCALSRSKSCACDVRGALCAALGCSGSWR